ncbi:unnamed protein product, partial [Rotaria socialis]
MTYHHYQQHQMKKRSSPANNEVLFALSPIDRPALTTMQNRNLIH